MGTTFFSREEVKNETRESYQGPVGTEIKDAEKAPNQNTRRVDEKEDIRKANERREVLGP